MSKEIENMPNSFLLLLGKFVRRTRISHADKAKIACIGIIILIIMSFVKEIHIVKAQKFLTTLILPIKMSAYEISQFPKAITAYFDVKRENDALKCKINELKISNIQIQNSLVELEELKKIFDIKYHSEKFNNIEKVLGYANSIYSSNIIITNTNEITQQNSIAITPDGLIGLIDECFAKSAEILPVSSSRIAIPVKTYSGIHMIISGTNHCKMISREIQDDGITKLSIGEILYTSGEGGMYPAGIPVAKITNIKMQINEIEAMPIVDINGINYVWIVEQITSKSGRISENGY